MNDEKTTDEDIVLKVLRETVEQVVCSAFKDAPNMGAPSVYDAKLIGDILDFRVRVDVKPLGGPNQHELL